MKLLKAKAYLDAGDPKKAKAEAGALAGGTSPGAGGAKVLLGLIAARREDRPRGGEALPRGPQVGHGPQRPRRRVQRPRDRSCSSRARSPRRQTRSGRPAVLPPHGPGRVPGCRRIHRGPRGGRLQRRDLLPVSWGARDRFRGFEVRIQGRRRRRPTTPRRATSNGPASGSAASSAITLRASTLPTHRHASRSSEAETPMPTTFFFGHHQELFTHEAPIRVHPSHRSPRSPHSSQRRRSAPRKPSTAGRASSTSSRRRAGSAS